MSQPTLKPGQVGWMDLTVADAPALREFYEYVTGWTSSSVDMGDYQDFCMHPAGNETPVAGICHSRGPNAGLPPVWVIYIVVADLDESLRRLPERGGKVRSQIRGGGAMGRYCLIEDPAGAVAALFEPAKA